MRKFILVLVLTTFSLFGASFDCTKVKSDVEKMICQNDELSKLDEELDKVYKEALSKTDNKEKLKNYQKEWILNNRNRCNIESIYYLYGDKKNCLVYFYTNRIEQLSLSMAKYELALDNNVSVCQPILKLFNDDIEKYGKLIFENHHEFNWLKWEYKYYIYDSHKQDKTTKSYFFNKSAEYDINNDGKDEIVWYSYIVGELWEDHLSYVKKEKFEDINGSFDTTISNNAFNVPNIFYTENEATMPESILNSFDVMRAYSRFVRPLKFQSSYYTALFGYSFFAYGEDTEELFPKSSNLLIISQVDEENKIHGICYFYKKHQIKTNIKDK